MTRLSIKEFCILILTNLYFTFWRFWEFTKVVFKYYPKKSFYKIDLYLLYQYFLNNPFKISKRFLLKKREEEVYAYGETPLTTLEKIANCANITEKDRLYELGCGRARTCFWLHTFTGCSVVGIDYVPEFILKAERVRKKFDLKNIKFRCEDFLTSDFSDATCIYLFGTCLKEKMILDLVDKILQTQKSMQVITVSFPLKDYTHHPAIHHTKTLTVPFPWGWSEVYFHKFSFDL